METAAAAGGAAGAGALSSLLSQSQGADEVSRRLQSAAESKEKGNSAFGAGDLNGALTAYHHAALYLRDLRPSDDSSRALVQSMTIAVQNNLAACHMKLKRWQRVIDCVSKALALDPDSAKALYRRGAARRQLHDIDGAKEDLERAASLAPEDKAIRAEIQALEVDYANYHQRARKMYARMFA